MVQRMFYFFLFINLADKRKISNAVVVSEQVNFFEVEEITWYLKEKQQGRKERRDLTLV